MSMQRFLQFLILSSGRRIFAKVQVNAAILRRTAVFLQAGVADLPALTRCRDFRKIKSRAAAYPAPPGGFDGSAHHQSL
jgi:hypothetical protein